LYNIFVTYFEFLTHFENGEFAAIYTVSGEDLYFVDSVVHRFCSIVKDCKDINIVHFEDFEVERIVDECQTIPFLSPKKIIVANGKGIKLGQLDPLKKYLANPNLSVVLLIVNPKVNVVYSSILNIDCNKISVRELCVLIQQKLEAKGCSIQSDALSTLILFCDQSMQKIDNELNKLCAYKTNSKITLADIELLVVPSQEYKAFALSEAVAKRDNDKALTIYNALVDSGQEPVMLNALLYGHFRRLLYCSISKDNSEDIAKYLGVKPYAVTIAQRQAKNFSAISLKKICGIFWQVDKDYKVGKISVAESTQKLILSILNI